MEQAIGVFDSGVGGLTVVRSLMQRLPAEHREVLLLVAVEELSYEQVALVIGVPIGTVMSRLSRARARLRQEMQGQGQEQGQDRDGSTPAARIQRVK